MLAANPVRNSTALNPAIHVPTTETGWRRSALSFDAGVMMPFGSEQQGVDDQHDEGQAERHGHGAASPASGLHPRRLRGHLEPGEAPLPHEPLELGGTLLAQLLV